ncbi:hypothetical protein [Stackebrandtia nassauensis]|nr:hypothetical protein [Stackebrandtia nassauensis]
MTTPGVLVVDIGSSHTIAMIRRGDGTVETLLSDHSPPSLPATLAQVRDACARTMPEPPASVTITHPASWGPTKRLEVAEHARDAGLGAPTLLPAPVAATRYLVDVLGHALPVGATVFVADFDETGFAAAVLSHTPGGFAVLAADDARAPDATAMPVESAVRVGQAVLGSAGVPAERVATVMSIGAASRSPLATDTVQRVFGRPPFVVDQPELAAAHGALFDVHALPGPGAPPLIPVSGTPQPGPAAPMKPPRRLATVILGITAAFALVFVTVTAVANATIAAPADPESTADVKRDAGTAAEALLSYDHKDMDASITEAKSYTTEGFGREYVQNMEDLRPTAESEKASIEAEVVDIGIVENTGEAVEVLVFVNQTTTNSNIEGSRVDKSRVTLTMVLGHGGWKVDDMKAL